MLLGAWPVRPAARATVPRRRRGRRLATPCVGDETPDPIEAPDRARARAFGAHHWPGEAIFTVGERRTVAHGRWRLTLDPSQRAQRLAGGALALDPSYPEAWRTQLEALLTLQVPGARLAVADADARGWRLLELRAPTRPETVVQVDQSGMSQVFGGAGHVVRVELRVHVGRSSMVGCP